MKLRKEDIEYIIHAIQRRYACTVEELKLDGDISLKVNFTNETCLWIKNLNNISQYCTKEGKVCIGLLEEEVMRTVRIHIFSWSGRSSK